MLGYRLIVESFDDPITNYAPQNFQISLPLQNLIIVSFQSIPLTEEKILFISAYNLQATLKSLQLAKRQK